MKSKKHSGKASNPELIDEENPEITPEELRRNRRGRPAKDEQERKVNQTLRIDQDVLEAYRQEGKGWQTRINRVLRENMPKHQK